MQVDDASRQLVGGEPFDNFHTVSRRNSLNHLRRHRILSDLDDNRFLASALFFKFPSRGITLGAALQSSRPDLAELSLSLPVEAARRLLMPQRLSLLQRRQFAFHPPGAETQFTFNLWRKEK
ncbi:hypothetical protein [Lacipirellula parvula]|uniref:Uncharacterized protein n=1 Tax=Lacipirellula parvula TaxID=2650471 RepID=A0A5K7XJ76_9BACT|nr:hypothetical protein [Lacipirellula parvula]BBO34273.1 hypothetical protein PLANPX_3885 [Lacipirellula parvula]